jgi:release factor glutamine methyltransferase
MRIKEIYKTTLQRLRDAGWDDAEARGTARLLTDEAAGARFSHLAQPEKTLHSAALSQWEKQLEQVSEGVPLPYVFGRREFYGLEFICDSRALIPRPETELLVELAVEKLKTHAAPRIADLGTGSGCIAVSLAHELPRAEIWATDISSDALQLARTNAEKIGVASRVHFVRGTAKNWAAPLQNLRFDAVLSNPPYIAPRDIETLQPQVREHEPRTALDGGADGLDCYRQLAAQCHALLNDGAFFAAELGAGQFDDVKKLFESFRWTVDYPLRDFQDIERVLVAF